MGEGESMRRFKPLLALVKTVATFSMDERRMFVANSNLLIGVHYSHRFAQRHERFFIIRPLKHLLLRQLQCGAHFAPAISITIHQLQTLSHFRMQLENKQNFGLKDVFYRINAIKRRPKHQRII